MFGGQPKAISFTLTCYNCNVSESITLVKEEGHFAYRCWGQPKFIKETGAYDKNYIFKPIRHFWGDSLPTKCPQCGRPIRCLKDSSQPYFIFGRKKKVSVLKRITIFIRKVYNRVRYGKN
jgi:hypothetical protein